MNEEQHAAVLTNARAIVRQSLASDAPFEDHLVILSAGLVVLAYDGKLPIPMKLYRVSNQGISTRASVMVLAPDEQRAHALASAKLKEHAAGDETKIYRADHWTRLTVEEVTNVDAEWTSEVQT